MYYDILKDEMRIVGHANSLKKHQLEQLYLIRESLRSRQIVKQEWVDATNYTPEKEDPAQIKQKELVRNIHEAGLKQLREILEDKVELYNIEHPCDPYGRVDMVYMGNGTVYPIEVKCNQGGHDLIGQISKYDLSHRLKLHLKFYEQVKSVTICKSYHSYTLDRLKSLGIATLLYSGEGETLKLRKI